MAREIPPLIMAVVKSHSTFARFSARNNARVREHWPKLFSPPMALRVRLLGLLLLIAIPCTLLSAAVFNTTTVLGIAYSWIALVLAFLVYPALLTAYTLQFRRARLYRRKRVSDKDFSQSMEAQGLGPICLALAIRHALARTRRLPPDVIRVDETCHSFGGFSEWPLLHEFAVYVTDRLSGNVNPMDLADLLVRYPRRFSIADLIHGVRTALEELGLNACDLRFLGSSAASDESGEKTSNGYLNQTDQGKDARPCGEDSVNSSKDAPIKLRQPKALIDPCAASLVCVLAVAQAVFAIPAALLGIVGTLFSGIIFYPLFEGAGLALILFSALDLLIYCILLLWPPVLHIEGDIVRHTRWWRTCRFRLGELQSVLLDVRSPERPILYFRTRSGKSGCIVVASAADGQQLESRLHSRLRVLR